MVVENRYLGLLLLGWRMILVLRSLVEIVRPSLISSKEMIQRQSQR